MGLCSYPLLLSPRRSRIQHFVQVLKFLSNFFGQQHFSDVDIYNKIFVILENVVCQGFYVVFATHTHTHLYI